MMKPAAARFSLVFLLAIPALATAQGQGWWKAFGVNLQVGLAVDRTHPNRGEVVKLSFLVLNNGKETLRLAGPCSTTVALFDGTALIPCPGQFCDVTLIRELQPNALVVYSLEHAWEEPGTYRLCLVWSDGLNDQFEPLIRKVIQGAPRPDLRITMDQAPPERPPENGRKGAFVDVSGFSVSTPSLEVTVRE
jgi:hypothetical protein